MTAANELRAEPNRASIEAIVQYLIDNPIGAGSFLPLAGGTMAGEILGLATDEDGLDVDPVGDADADLLTVGVTGAPILKWDESEDSFSQNKGHVFTSGNVGIGLIPASSRGLDISVDKDTGFAAYFFNDGNNQSRYGVGIQCGPDADTGQQLHMRFFDGDGNEQGRINNNGAGNMVLVDISDARIKSNIVDAPEYDTRKIIQGLQLRLYDIRGEQGGKGFIAQEVALVFPEMVTDAIEEDGLLAVSSETPLTRVLLQAMKEQQQEMDKLKERIITLESKQEVSK